MPASAVERVIESYHTVTKAHAADSGGGWHSHDVNGNKHHSHTVQLAILIFYGDYIMSKKKRGRPQGHDCKVCGEYKANEKFSGKGHAAYSCKACSRLSAAEQAEAMTINRLMNFPMNRLSASDRGWLENRLHDQRPEVASLAKEIYSLHFPFAERNARKKELTINKLTFELHTTFFDEWGDGLPINQRFTADRISRILTMTDFDTDGVEQSLVLAGRKMSTLLRRTVHSLEIFMWPEDYDLDPESPTGCFWDVWDEDLDEDFLEEETPSAEPGGRPVGRLILSTLMRPLRKLFLTNPIYRIARRSSTLHCWNISSRKKTNSVRILTRIHYWSKDIIQGHNVPYP